MSNNKWEYFGKYILLEKIASGGMAEVFLARSNGVGGIGRFFAIKRILPQFSDNHDFLRMFKDEAKIAMNLSHSNVVSIYEFGIENNQLFLVMDYVEGKNLRQVTNKLSKTKKKFSIEQIVYIINKVAGGLDHAHRCLDGSTGKPLNITHRDISPQNIMVSYEGEVKIVDFGIAKAESQIETTRAGTLKGKFGYMSPEQAEGLTVDLRTDIFSLGIVLWELLTGERLFISNNEINTLRKIRECQVPSLKQYIPNIHPELDRIVNKALTRDRNLRYQTAAGMHRDLNRFLNRQYPDFSPQDFSVSIKTLFADDVLEIRNKLVKFSQTPVKNGTQDKKEDSGIYLDTQTLPPNTDSSDSFFKSNHKDSNKTPFSSGQSGTITMSSPELSSADKDLIVEQLGESTGTQDLVLDNFDGDSSDKTELLTEQDPPTGLDLSEDVTQPIIENQWDNDRPLKSTKSSNHEDTYDQSFIPERLQQKTSQHKASNQNPINHQQLIEHGKYTESDFKDSQFQKKSRHEEKNRFDPYQRMKVKKARRNSPFAFYFMFILALSILSIPTFYQLEKLYPNETLSFTRKLHLWAKEIHPELSAYVFPLSFKEKKKDTNIIITETPTGEKQTTLSSNENSPKPNLNDKKNTELLPPPLPEQIRITVQSQPSGAEIIINNESTGSITPATIEIPFEKPFSLKLKRKGFVEYYKPKLIGKNLLQKKISAKLIEIQLATVKIDVIPPRNARVYINNEWLEGEALPIVYKVPANSNITIKAYNPYTKETVSRVVNLRPNSKNDVVLKLDKAH